MELYFSVVDVAMFHVFHFHFGKQKLNGGKYELLIVDWGTNNAFLGAAFKRARVDFI